MNKEKLSAKNIQEGRGAIISFIKNKVFDLIGIAILIAMFALMLNVLEGRDLTWDTFREVTVQIIPFYICAMMLSLNYYKKGAYGGKQTESFTGVVDRYSDLVESLTSNQIRHFKEFCKDYNDSELKDLQTSILSKEGLTYDLFVNDYLKKTNAELKKLLGKDGARAVRKAKRAKIMGISVNSILGNRRCRDNTDIGPTENQLMAGRSAWYAICYIGVIAFLTFLVAKNLFDWNWMRLLYELAKVVYIFVRSYMRFFEGYEDITIKLADSINHKADIIKSYPSWYKDKGYTDDEDTSNSGAKTDSEVVTNN